MNNIFLLRILLCVSFFYCDVAASSQKSCELAPGIRLEISVRCSPTLQVMYLLTVDPAYRKITLEHAAGDGSSREPVSSIVDRVAGLAGLNCNNYRRGGEFNGNPVDFLKIRGDLFSDAGVQRSVICWKKGACKPLIGPLQSRVKLSIGGTFYPVDRVNQPRLDDEAVLYTPAFGSSTRTRQGGHEIVFINNRIVNVFKEKGNTKIPRNGFIYSVGKSCSIGQLSAIKKKMSVRYKHEFMIKQGTRDVDISGMDYIASGAGLLISESSRVTNFEDDFKSDRPIAHFADEIAADFSQKTEQKWLIFEQHPRTAVGLLPDGKWLFVVVDGRQPGYSMGISLPDLAECMLGWGCTCALNMGGGGCSTLNVCRTIINSPSGTTTHEKLVAQKDKQKHERPVCSAFVIF